MSTSDESPPRPVWSVAIPEGATPPFDVYVNGVRQAPGPDYRVDGRWLRFERRLIPRIRMGFGRRIMLLAGIGVYGDLRADQVDLHYTAADGTRRAASHLTVIPPQEPLPAG